MDMEHMALLWHSQLKNTTNIILKYFFCGSNSNGVTLCTWTEAALIYYVLNTLHHR